jgi:hypothetical protein
MTARRLLLAVNGGRMEPKLKVVENTLLMFMLCASGVYASTITFTFDASGTLTDGLS